MSAINGALDSAVRIVTGLMAEGQWEIVNRILKPPAPPEQLEALKARIAASATPIAPAPLGVEVVRDMSVDSRGEIDLTACFWTRDGRPSSLSLSLIAQKTSYDTWQLSLVDMRQCRSNSPE